MVNTRCSKASKSEAVKPAPLCSLAALGYPKILPGHPSVRAGQNRSFCFFFLFLFFSSGYYSPETWKAAAWKPTDSFGGELGTSFFGCAFISFTAGRKLRLGPVLEHSSELPQDVAGQHEHFQPIHLWAGSLGRREMGADGWEQLLEEEGWSERERGDVGLEDGNPLPCSSQTWFSLPS